MDSSELSKSNKKKQKQPTPVVVPKTVTDIQRIKLERLMQDPEKQVIIPDRKKDKKAHEAPEFVRNVMGSSAGAGSGEFHVYRHLRRKEYARQKHIDERAKKEELDEEFHKRIEENKIKCETKTAKKRAKRPVFVIPIVIQGHKLRAILMPHRALSYIPLQMWTFLGNPSDIPEVRSGNEPFNQIVQLGESPSYDFEATFKVIQEGDFIQLGFEALTDAKVVVDFAARQMTIGNTAQNPNTVNSYCDNASSKTGNTTDNSISDVHTDTQQHSIEQANSLNLTEELNTNISQSSQLTNPSITNLTPKEFPLKSILKKVKTDTISIPKSNPKVIHSNVQSSIETNSNVIKVPSNPLDSSVLGKRVASQKISGVTVTKQMKIVAPPVKPMTRGLLSNPSDIRPVLLSTSPTKHKPNGSNGTDTELLSKEKASSEDRSKLLSNNNAPKNFPLKSILKKAKSETLPNLESKSELESKDSSSQSTVSSKSSNNSRNICSNQLECSVPKKVVCSAGEKSVSLTPKTEILPLTPRTQGLLPNPTNVRQVLLPTPMISGSPSEGLLSKANVSNSTEIVLSYEEPSPGLLPTPRPKQEPSVGLLPTPHSKSFDELFTANLTKFKEPLCGLLPTPRALVMQEPSVALLPTPCSKSFDEPTVALLPTPRSKSFEEQPVGLLPTPCSNELTNRLLPTLGTVQQDSFSIPKPPFEEQPLGLLRIPGSNELTKPLLSTPGTVQNESFTGSTNLGLLPTPNQKLPDFLEGISDFSRPSVSKLTPPILSQGALLSIHPYRDGTFYSKPLLELPHPCFL